MATVNIVGFSFYIFVGFFLVKTLQKRGYPMRFIRISFRDTNQLNTNPLNTNRLKMHNTNMLEYQLVGIPIGGIPIG